MSDTMSISSVSSGGGDTTTPGGMVVEEVGQLAFSEFPPRRIVLLNYTLAALSDDGRLLLGEVRTRGGDDWALAGRSLTALDPERRYIDLALVPNVQHGQGGASVVFLIEKKNKERFVAAHNIIHGKILGLGDEFTAYDKVNVLGKGVTHIVADHAAVEPTIFSASNLIRKLRIEDGGTTLKPTPARVPVPTECQDGTLALCVQGGAAKHPSAAFLVASFRTKSATKNKFMIEWFQTSKKDDLSICKTPIKLTEDHEPFALLADPRDSRVVYALCRNKSNASTSLFKLNKGRKHDEPLHTFNFEVTNAAMGISASDQNVITLIVDDGQVGRIFTLQKTEGFRGRHPACAHCAPLEAVAAPSHVISCVTHRWQLQPAQVDAALSVRPVLQVALATLLDAHTGKYVHEPESDAPYRVRIVDCPTQGMTTEAILLEDLERTFENCDLSSAVLKACLSHAPSRDCHSKLSGWLMTGRLAAIELHFVKQSSDYPSSGGDRFVVKPISADKFRSFITDVDWTQLGQQRQGTFTLDEKPKASPRPSTAGSRIPAPRSAAPEAHESQEMNDHIKGLVRTLSSTLRNTLATDAALKQYLATLQQNVEEIQQTFEILPEADRA